MIFLCSEQINLGKLDSHLSPHKNNFMENLTKNNRIRMIFEK